jgi:hypothetical protein
LVTIKRCGGEFLKPSLGKIPSQTLSKTTATARGDDDTTIVGVYDILLSNCMRRAYYRKKLGVAEPTQSVMPYIIRGRAIELSIARTLFANATMERNRRYEKRGIVCYTDLSDLKRMIKDTSTGRQLVPQDTQFKGYLMLVLYHMVIADIEEAMILINYSSRELIWHHNDSEGRCWFYRQANAKGPGIECWRVSMSKDDYARELLWEQMLRRKNAFLNAMRASDVSLLTGWYLSRQRLAQGPLLPAL